MTLLFTDIEGSTRLWETQQTAMRAALTRHDALLPSSICSHRGHVFKTVGDAFCAAFHTAPAALCAALEARDGDYFGAPLNRVARLVAAGHGAHVGVFLQGQGRRHPDGGVEAQCGHGARGQRAQVGQARARARSRLRRTPRSAWWLREPRLEGRRPPLAARIGSRARQRRRAARGCEPRRHTRARGRIDRAPAPGGCARSTEQHLPALSRPALCDIWPPRRSGGRPAGIAGPQSEGRPRPLFPGDYTVLKDNATEAFELAKREVLPVRLLGTAMALHSLGRAAESDAALTKMIDDHGAAAGYQIAEACAWRGEVDRAFEWLENAYAARVSVIPLPILC